MPAYLLYGKGKSRYESGSSGLSDGAFSGGYQGNDGNLYPYSLRGCGGGTASSGQPEIMSEWEKVKRDFYESNGLEDDEPAEKPVQRAFDKNKKQDTGSMMSEEGVAAMCELLKAPERSILIIMIDRKGVMDAFLHDHPRMRDMFPARVDIAALSVDTLLGYAREYAGKQQCEIDEFGISALQSRILSSQTVNHSVTLEDIRDIVDEAIYYASRKSLSSLVDSFSRRKSGTGNRIILRDKDFLHY